MKYRISHPDPLNWIIEAWEAPRLLKTGKRKGQMSAGHWKILGYWPTFETAARALPEEHLNQALKGTTGVTLDQVSAAQSELKNALASLRLSESRGEDFSVISTQGSSGDSVAS